MPDFSTYVIAIDGPAGAGKSTVAKRLAVELGMRYLDTGAMYRALALKALRQGLYRDDSDGLARLLAATQISFGQGSPQPVLLDGVDVSAEIRTLEIGELASAISVHSDVRKGLVANQQALVAKGGVILEGRDATTVIAPGANLKIYLTASLEERASRRTQELGSKGTTAEFGRVRTQILERDHRDITRADSPLRVADEAHVVETGTLSIDEVVAKIRGLIPSDETLKG